MSADSASMMSHTHTLVHNCNGIFGETFGDFLSEYVASLKETHVLIRTQEKGEIQRHSRVQ
jgi:hypothetical protein